MVHGVTIMELWFESSSVCVPRVAHGAGQADIMNRKATASYVAIRSRRGMGSHSQPSYGLCKLCSARKLCCRISRQFELLGRSWACSRREDTTCSGRNAVWDSYLALFSEFLGLCLVERQLDLSSVAARLRGSLVWFVRRQAVRESRRPYTRHLALSRVVAEGLHHRQYNFLTVVHLGVRESRRPHTRHLALSRVVAEGLHHRQCNFLIVVHLWVCPKFLL
ncbi:hypothetical protein Taro_052127 [Colocasia esculenta]|uniref:Uncharacterized protein n=1 Tax=Colocasia esculenta TaxID=4460 RepID=A0A843XJA7_COLES|nr:hypothetical protein [Colocasia esculenta]